MANKYPAKRNPYLTFSIPESLDVLDILPSDLHHKADEAHYFISLLIFKTAHQSCITANGYTCLSATILNQIMDNRKRYKILECLSENGIIECDGFYTPKRKSYGYRLNSRFADDRVKTIQATNRRIIRSLDAYFAKKLSEDVRCWLPVHHRLDKEQYKLDIDREQADEIVAKLTPKKRRRTKKNTEQIARSSRLCQTALVNNIDEKHHKLSVGKTGRVCNCITSLNREIRPALRYKGKPLESVDISNSQPALLAKLVKDSLDQRQAAFLEDLALYIDLTSKGEFYKYIHQLIENTGKQIPLDEIKRKFLTDIFAKKKWVETKSGFVVPRDYDSLVESVFRQEFPTIYRFICETNKADAETGITWDESHSVLIRKLQELEAKLVIEDAAVRAFSHPAKPFVLTLHDAIFCGQGESELMAELLQQAAQNQGHQIKTKKDYYR